MDMSSSDVKSQGDGNHNSALCDCCKDEGLKENAVVFCPNCWKYLCTDCKKLHGKLHRDHKLKTGDEMPQTDAFSSSYPCKIHTNYVVDTFCEEHGSVFCCLCKSLKHDDCKVQKIKDILKDMNVKQEVDIVLASLAELSLIMAKQEDETRNKLTNYTKAKSAIEKKVKHLKKDLVEILNSYNTVLDDQQQSDIENLNAKKESYGCLHQNLEDYIKPARASEIENNFQLFLSLVEMKQQYKTYSEFHETLQKDIDIICSFTLKDERLPGLVKELSEISCLEYVADAHQDAGGENDNEKNATTGKVRRDQCCQIDPTVFEELEIRKKQQACFTGGTEMRSIERESFYDLGDYDDDTECGSTDDVPEKSFGNIKSCSLLKEATMGKLTSITDCCSLPSGQMVLCDTGYNILKFLDADMEVVMEIGLRQSAHSLRYVAVVDRKTVMVSFNQSKLLQFISVLPEVRFGNKVSLVCDCDGLDVYKKEIYVYSRCLDERSTFQYEGFQILSLKGEILVTFPLYDNISCFSLNNDGSIVYFGSRLIKRSKKSFMKCITREGDIVFQANYPESDLPRTIVASDKGNVIIYDPASRTICATKEDGSKKVLVTAGDKYSKFANVNTICYNKHKETLAVIARGDHSCSTHIVKLYKLEF